MEIQAADTNVRQMAMKREAIVISVHFLVKNCRQRLQRTARNIIELCSAASRVAYSEKEKENLCKTLTSLLGRKNEKQVKVWLFQTFQLD